MAKVSYRLKGKLLGGCAAIIVVSLIPSGAYAQAAGSAAPTDAPSSQADDSVPVMNDIVVVAQRRAQRAQDVPASLVALSGDTLATRQITTTAQLASAVPNMQASQPYGAGDPPTFTIRGISTTDFSQNASRPIAVYIDEGIRQMPLMEAMPLFDVDHVEVLRGPQGALYGKNATGGAISIITKEPGYDLSGYLTAGYGNFNRRETQGAVQIPLVQDKLAVRLAYTYTKDDGAIKQVSSNPATSGKNLDQTDILGLRASVRYQPTSDLDIVLRYNHYRIAGRAAGVYAGNNIDFASAGLPIYDTFPGAHREGLGFFENDNNVIGHKRITDDNVNGQIKWAITPDISLFSVTTYDKGNWPENDDPDGLPLDQFGNQTVNATNISQFVQEVRLTGKTGPLQWLLGGFYSRDSVDMFQQLPIYTDPRCGAACDFGLGGGGTGIVQTNQFNQKRRSYSGYGRLEYAFNDQWSLAGGLRWSRDRIAINNYTAYVGDSATPLLATTIAPITDSRSYSNVSGEATLTYKPSSHLLAYASFKQGYRTGAYNSQAYTSPLEVTAAPPETANSWEAGIKSDFLDRAVTFNLTGFYTKYKNQQITSSEVVGGALITPLRSIPRSRIYGAEVDLVIRPTRTLTLNLSGGYANSAYTEGSVGGVSVVGKRLSASPRLSGSVAADWRIAEFDKSNVTLHIDTALSSRQYYDVHNTPGVDDPGHTVTNAQLSYQFSKWNASLWTTNVFNKHYFTYVLNTTGLGAGYFIRGNPRMFGIRIKRDF